ncbi:MAG: sugar ABC transporter ATP-binding protein [Victivallaceae bacterium]
MEAGYGNTRVLDGVSFTLNRGRILGLVGENGAGKSTLVRCILGLVRPRGGTVEARGRVAAIHQEFNLSRDLSAVENIFLGRELCNRFGLLRRREMRRLTTAEFERISVSVNPDVPVAELTVSDRQMVEIAKATIVNSEILIMDEPSTLLNREETGRLFGIMREFRKRGNSVIYISHKLSEVREICDEIAVLRDGTLVDYIPDAKTVDESALARKMVGRELNRLFPEKLPPPEGPARLAARELCSGKLVRGVSFELHKGEILGVAGLTGSGKDALAETIAGLRRIDSGEILLAGRRLHLRSPRAALEAGISYLSDDRQESGLLLDFPVEANVTLASLSGYVRHGFLAFAKIRASALEYVRRFSIKCAGPRAPVADLSGGNQQKVAIAKGLDSRPEVFIFNEPTRGVDVAARREIYDFIRGLAASGVACLMVCSDLEELLGMCRRVMVMREGRLAGIVENESLSEENIIYLATGVE